MLYFGRFVICGFFGASAILSSVANAGGYSVLDFGNLNPTALNNIGQVVGTYGNAANGAFVTGANGNGITSLGFLGAYAVPKAINDSGYIIGSTSIVGSNNINSSAAFLVSANGAYTLAPGFTVNGINSSGQVVGSNNNGVFVTGANGQGIVFTSAVTGSAQGINNAGQIAGNFPSPWYPGMYTLGYATGKAEQGLTTFSVTTNVVQQEESIGVFDVTTVLAINNSGQVFGEFNAADGMYHAYISSSDGGSLIDLNAYASATNFYGSDAKGFNDFGQVVGTAETNVGNETWLSHAFVTGNNGLGMTDLNSLVSLGGGDYFTTAEGINNNGQIIAKDEFGDGYLLTPQLAASSLLHASAVPEPENAALFALGVAGVGLAMRRRALV